MKNLFIDTASGRVIIAITDDKEVISIRNEASDHQLSMRIMPLIDAVFQEAKITPKDIDVIYVVTGPGSFTGVRIGVTVAKTMAWALHKNIIPLSELELLATTPFTGDFAVSLIDARRDASFAGIYDQHGRAYLRDRYITNDDLVLQIPANSQVSYISYDTSSRFDVVEPQVDLMKMIHRHQNDTVCHPHQVKPEYLKLTEAEENLRKAQS